MGIKDFNVLYVSSEYWIGSRGYRLFRYFPESDRIEPFSSVNDSKNAFLASMKLTRRLFRAEIRHLYHFKDDTWMCIGKKAIFRLDHTTGRFEKCCVIAKGSRPMNLCQAKNGAIYYGEYCYNPTREEMRIFRSPDNGDSWEVAYTFGNGEINHIHGLFVDPYSDKLWVATGDDDCACIFGYTEDGFKTFVRCYKGSQQYRVCQPLFTPDKIIFATDSQYEQNYIRAIDRTTGEVKNIQAIQGSGIYGVQFGDKMMISTTVEPSKVNLDRHSHVWFSANGKEWKELASYEKDIFPMTYFQFGSILFPTYEGDSNFLVWNGRAVKGLDRKSMIKKLR